MVKNCLTIRFEDWVAEIWDNPEYGRFWFHSVSLKWVRCFGSRSYSGLGPFSVWQLIWIWIISSLIFHEAFVKFRISEVSKVRNLTLSLFTKLNSAKLDYSFSNLFQNWRFWTRVAVNSRSIVCKSCCSC